jgi:phosphoribosylformylglycinamidine synthase
MATFLVSVRSRSSAGAPEHRYLLDGDLDDAAVALLTNELLHDRVVQQASWQSLDTLATTPDAGLYAEIAYRPGVTDNEAESVRIGAERLGISTLQVVRTLRCAAITSAAEARALYNPLIQIALVGPANAIAKRQQWYRGLLQTPHEVIPQIALVPLRDADDEELLRISRQGILALDLEEMRAIQAYYRAEGRDPRDGELETIAQTWSEHCSHKTFKALVDYQQASQPSLPSSFEWQKHPALQRLETAPHTSIDSLIKTFLMTATQEVLAARGDDWVLSAFVDNAGIVAFDQHHEISFKVETHNHPSALEPFGGANTGVGGVVRDVLGVSAQPIANTDVLCFGMLDTPAEQISDGVLHPRTVAAGVVAGVRDYGNKLGIPTVNGAVLYDPGYLANPLVYCGTVGLAPRGRHPRGAMPGDLVVVLGGRTGRDGIHGATFSSVELTHTTAEEVGSAVQIGDPITEKKMIDVVLQARDAGYYRAITDCGAGGLSSAVGEMGEATGVAVTLEDVPLKYAGLQPWEIWLSEAQERMVLAVPPEHRDALLTLCQAEDVEATVIGTFRDDGHLVVQHLGQTVVDLGMEFLHGGRPQRVLKATWAGGSAHPTPATQAQSANEALLALLAHPNIASKAPIVRTYDHEVQGRTVIKPLVGAHSAGPGDAAVLQPIRSSTRGIALGCGINPRYGCVDPYWMALACVDEAMRNIVAVGGDPRQAAILDNFCWGDPRQPDRMAGLVRAAAGCYDAAIAYGSPFISGKDSLNNEYRAADGSRTPIPPTLLISALAMVPDIRQTVTMDLKAAGNRLYLVGLTKPELGGSHYQPNAASAIPQVDLALAPQLLGALHDAIRKGLVRSCHDLSEGGLAVALAEMAIAGGIGCTIDLAQVPQHGVADDATLLFAESATRLLVEVNPAEAAAFEAAMAGFPHAAIGSVGGERLVVQSHSTVIDLAVTELSAAWQSTTVV